MGSVEAQLATAEALRRASNYSRASEICYEILEAQSDHLGAFNCLFSIHMAQNNYKDAYEFCEDRLSRLPLCPDTHISKLIAHINMRSGAVDFAGVDLKARKILKAIHEHFPDYPGRRMQADIIYSYSYKSAKDTLRLIKQARDQGLLSSHWLDEIEADAAAEAGQVLRARKALQSAIGENGAQFETLQALSISDYYSGHLFSAIKHARQAKSFAPEKAAMSQEVIIVSMIALIPVFWFAQAFIMLKAFLLGRVPVSQQGTAFLVLCYAAVLGYGFIVNALMEITSIPPWVLLSGAGLQLGWILYDFFAFQSVGAFFANRKTPVSLSKKY